MGIGWTLQGVDATSSARNAAESRSGRVVLGGGLDSDRTLVAPLECGEPIRGARRRRADGEAVNATNRVGTKLNIVPSGGVDGCGLSPGQTADLLTGERMSDDVKSSASALGTRSVQRGPLLVVEQSGEVGLLRAGMNSAQGQCAPSVPVGKQTKVPNLYEPSRQDVKKEAPYELSSLESHHAASVVVPRVAPAKAHVLVLDACEPSIRDGNPMRVACQILQHMLGSSERRLGVNHPLLLSQTSEQRVEGAGRRVQRSCR